MCTLVTLEVSNSVQPFRPMLSVQVASLGFYRWPCTSGLFVTHVQQSLASPAKRHSGVEAGAAKLRL
jgi:hypothetical protein